MLKTFREGQLVTVAVDGADLDGVVAHVAGLVKVEVAMVPPGSDPVFRAVHPKALTPRDEPGPDDEALRRLIHRAAAPGGHGGAGGASGRGRQAHTRGADHRATGR
jgi:hypothetical protein